MKERSILKNKYYLDEGDGKVTGLSGEQIEKNNLVNYVDDNRNISNTHVPQANFRISLCRSAELAADNPLICLLFRNHRLEVSHARSCICHLLA